MYAHPSLCLGAPMPEDNVCFRTPDDVRALPVLLRPQRPERRRVRARNPESWKAAGQASAQQGQRLFMYAVQKNAMP